MKSGLKKGLGNVIDLKVYLTTGKEGGNEEVTKIQKWMACGGDLTREEDPHYYFYRAGACAFKSGSKLDDCITKEKVPAATLAAIQNCTSDSARAKKLVSAMNGHVSKKGVHSFPSIYVNGKSDGGSVSSIVSKVCSLAKSRSLEVDPEACGGPPPGPPPPVRYHCDTSTKKCIELNEGHATLDSCQAACQ